MLSQRSLDASMGNLVAGVHEAYKLILENRSPSKINFSKNVLVAIVQVVQECSQFVIKYPEIQTFCALVMPVISITILSFTRVLPWEECPLGDSYQSRQL